MPANARILRQGTHARRPWDGGEHVVVCAKWATLNGSDRSDARVKGAVRKSYDDAKLRGDHASAQSIVSRLCDGAALDRLIDRLEGPMGDGKRIIFVAPTPAFNQPSQILDDGQGDPRPTNVLPRQFASHLAISLDGFQDHEIMQAARVGRTNLSRLERFLWQPIFDGAVDAQAVYVIVDDVLTAGGTMAALRNHIVSAGGTVAAYAALAHRSGVDQRLAVSRQMCNRLLKSYGSDIMGFWAKEIGHDVSTLTESEADFLCRWAERLEPGDQRQALQLLRTSLFEAAGGGNQQARRRRGTSPGC